MGENNYKSVINKINMFRKCLCVWRERESYNTIYK